MPQALEVDKYTSIVHVNIVDIDTMIQIKRHLEKNANSKAISTSATIMTFLDF